MLNPIITPPRVPLVDPNTGLISRAWYLFFLSLNNIANAVVDDPAVGPSPESLIASYDAMLETLTQEVQTQPSPSDLVAQMAEMQKQIEALAVVPSQVIGLLSQLADVNALNPSDGDKLIYDGTLGKWEQDSRSYLMLE
jgi:hypothetical protein